MNRRVVITGIGVVAPGGRNTKEYWDLLTAGRTATRAVSRFDATPFRSRIAAECDFEPAMEGLTARQERRMDRATQFAVVATRQALSDSGFESPSHRPHRTGVTIVPPSAPP